MKRWLVRWLRSPRRTLWEPPSQWRFVLGAIIVAISLMGDGIERAMRGGLDNVAACTGLSTLALLIGVAVVAYLMRPPTLSEKHDGLQTVSESDGRPDSKPAD